MHRDSTGFPLSVKPSHLVDPVEQMAVAEVLAAIVERACLYAPDVPVAEIKAKKLSWEKPNEASEVEKDSEGAYQSKKVAKEALTSVEPKVIVASSDLVRFICLKLCSFC